MIYDFQNQSTLPGGRFLKRIFLQVLRAAEAIHTFNKQISGVENAFIRADDLDYVIGYKISIWLFGLL